MKILTKKKVDEILKRITANEIIGVECIKDVESFKKHCDNNSEVVYLVGGFSGLNKVANTLERYGKDLLERSNHESTDM